MNEAALVRRIVCAPGVSDPEKTRARVAAWLDSIAATEAGASLRRLLADHPPAAALIEGVAEGSPFLWDIIEADPGRLLAVLEADPDTRLRARLAETALALAACSEEAEVMRLLRRLKTEAALLIALADVGGAWDVMRVTRALTDLADTAVGAAVDYLLAAAARAGRLAPKDPARPSDGSGYIVLAMGKMGAHELN